MKRLEFGLKLRFELGLIEDVQELKLPCVGIPEVNVLARALEVRARFLSDATCQLSRGKREERTLAKRIGEERLVFPDATARAVVDEADGRHSSEDR
jgi:hypothetical protein